MMHKIRSKELEEDYHSNVFPATKISKTQCLQLKEIILAMGTDLPIEQVVLTFAKESGVKDA